jgi:hypothetical protein
MSAGGVQLLKPGVDFITGVFSTVFGELDIAVVLYTSAPISNEPWPHEAGVTAISIQSAKKTETQKSQTS